MENWGNQCAQLLLGLLTQRQTVESGRLRQEHLNAWACLFGWFYITLRHWRSARYPYRKAISFICTVFYFVDKWHSGLQVHALSMLVLVGLGLSSRKLLQWACKLSCEPPSCLHIRLLQGAHIIGGIKSAKDAAFFKYFDDNLCCWRPCIRPVDARLGLEGRPCLAKAFTNCPPITCRRIPWRSRVFHQPDHLCCAGTTSVKAQLHQCVVLRQRWVLERQNRFDADSESLSCDWAALSWKHMKAII